MSGASTHHVSTICVLFFCIKKARVVPSSKGRRGVVDFSAGHFSASRHCDCGTYLLSIAVLPSPPQKKAAIHSRHLDTAGKVLQSVPKAAVDNECGFPMCAVAGLDRQTVARVSAKVRSRHFRPFGHGDRARIAKLLDIDSTEILTAYGFPNSCSISTAI